MKGTIRYFATVCICASVSLGAFDFVVSETYEHGTIQLNSQSLLITGAGVAEVIAKGASYVEVHGTTAPLQLDVGGVYALLLDDTSSMNYYGGETGDITFHDNAAAVIQGGRIDYISSYQYVLSPNQTYIPHIEIIVREYDDSNPNFITGIWNVDKDDNGEYDIFSINLLDQAGYDPVLDNIKFTIIPEPATLCMLGVSILLLRRRSE